MERHFYCSECGSENKYELRNVTRKYAGDGYSFEISVCIPFCTICGALIDDEEIETEITREANSEFRKALGIISVDDIQSILEKYCISGRFLGRLLGWDSSLMDKYLEGATPNKENSRKLRVLCDSSSFMELLKSAPEEVKIEPEYKISISKARA